jgi:hypothetical protein
MRLKEDASSSALNGNSTSTSNSSIFKSFRHDQTLNNFKGAAAHQLADALLTGKQKMNGFGDRPKRDHGSSLIDRLLSVAKATKPPPVDQAHKFYDEDYNDLVNFLYYLRYYRKTDQERHNSSVFTTNSPLGNHTESIYDKNLTDTFHYADYQPPPQISYEIGPLPAALIQLLIIVLVMLFVLLLCKCNKLMAFCQHQKTPEELEDERYHDTMRFKDYLCYICLRCKHKHRKRRHRKFIRKKFTGKSDFGPTGRSSRSYSLTQKLTRSGGVRKRKTSIIFRRRSAICQPANSNPSLTSPNSYRNKSRRRTIKVKMSNARVSMGGVIDESQEAVFGKENNANQNSMNENINNNNSKKVTVGKHEIINEDDYDDDDYDNNNNINNEEEDDENCVL